MVNRRSKNSQFILTYSRCINNKNKKGGGGGVGRTTENPVFLACGTVISASAASVRRGLQAKPILLEESTFVVTGFSPESDEMDG